jgi:hypothetical protein
MSAFKASRGAAGVVCLAAGLLLLTAGGAMASVSSLCLPAKEGKPVITPIKGVCPKHYTLSELGKEGPAGKEGSAGKEGPVGKEGKPGPSLLSEEEQKALKALLPYIKFNASGIGGKPTIQISRANLQIVNGLGTTETLNGVGNLIIGYDEEPGTQTGSHDLMLGTGQSYTSYGAILGGLENTASGPSSFVVGAHDTASGPNASVSGGQQNTANTYSASVSGGSGNIAGVRGETCCGNREADVYPSVSGGTENTAEGAGASVSGGRHNRATDAGPDRRFEDASVSGGIDNSAEGPGAWVSGGEGNAAGTESAEGYNPGPSSVSGGRHNLADGTWASVSGGVNNAADGPGASVSGGENNMAGGFNPGCCALGMGPRAPSVSGGYKNIAQGAYSSILGGKEDFVNGAPFNNTTGSWATVSGGYKNNAKSAYSSILGGKEELVETEYGHFP